MPNHETGKLIALEGIEGSGKTTMIQFVRAFLEAAGHRVITTREPGGTAVGDRIRDILLSKDMTPETETLLMFAARTEHIAAVIRPALAEGYTVITDRFVDSSYAYQGGGRGLGADRIAVLEEWACADVFPDLVLLFDLPVETALARARSRGALDRFESEDREFLERVRSAYLESSLDQLHAIDADRPVEAVRLDVEGVLADWLAG
jgi:dTMP kinase